MSWSQVTINTPTADFATANQSVEMVTLDPWTSGIAEGDDNFATLSFPNAVTAAIEKIGSRDTAVFALALCANNLMALAGEVQSLSGVFPVPYLQRIGRMAQAVDGLKASRMVLATPSASNKKFNLGALPKVQGIQKADLIQQAKARADNHQNTNPVDNLEAFVSEKNAHSTAVNAARDDATNGLTGGTGWRFYAESDIATAIKTGHPSYEMAYTAMLLFMGTPEELAFLTDIFQ